MERQGTSLHPHEYNALIELLAASESRGFRPIALTIPNATRVSGLSRSEIYRRLAAGDLEAVKAGARTLILWQSLEALLKTLPRARFRGSRSTRP
jgi:hypothetical protein